MEANYGANPRVYEIDNPENATFKITDEKVKESYLFQLLLCQKKMT